MSLFFPRVRAAAPEDARAEQVEEVSSKLCSEDVFVLETKDNLWIWHGRVSNRHFRSRVLSNVKHSCILRDLHPRNENLRLVLPLFLRPTVTRRL